MKRLLPLFFLAALLSSCIQYQYLTVSGVNIPKNDKNEFISENDTVKVQYRFTNYNGQIGIRIYNKTTEPLEIDWRKSAVIVDGKAVSYFSPTATISATVERDSARWQNSSLGFRDPAYLASLNGSVFINEPTQFIPPSSFIYKIPLALPVEPFQNLPERRAEKLPTKSTGNLFVSYKRMTFEKDSSPLQFRSYLTFRIGNTGSQKEFTVEHNFYVSEVWKTAAGPEEFPKNAVYRDDRFYLRP